MPRAWTIGVSRILQDWLDELEVPIAVLVPDEVVERIRSTVEAVSLQLGRHGGDGTVEAAENPAVRESPFGWGQRGAGTINIHQAEPGGVPDLVGEIPVPLDPFFGELEVTARRGHRGQSKS